MKSVQRALAFLTCGMCMLQMGGCSLTDILSGFTGA